MTLDFFAFKYCLPWTGLCPRFIRLRQAKAICGLIIFFSDREEAVPRPPEITHQFFSIDRDLVFL